MKERIWPNTWWGKLIRIPVYVPIYVLAILLTILYISFWELPKAILIALWKFPSSNFVWHIKMILWGDWGKQTTDTDE